MDKYEYNIKLDEIKALVGKQDYAGAAGICDTIEWRKVRSNNTLNMVADAYEATRQYDKAKNALLIAYERTPLGRQLAYRLTILSIKEKNFEEAEEFYEDFLEVSPRDPARYLLEYQLAKAKGTDIDVLIGILEEYSQEDVDERWQYELAVLYHRAGYRDKCIALCDEMILWFGDGKYVEKALELKMLYEPLTQSQQEKYDKQWERRTHQTSQEIASSENVSNQSMEPPLTDDTEKQTTLLDDGVKKSGDTEYSIKANGSIVGRAAGSGDVSDVVPAAMLREKLEAQEREISQREAEQAQESQRQQRVNAVAKAEVIFEEMKQVEEESTATTQESEIDEIQEEAEEAIETPAQESVTEGGETANSEEVSEEDVFTEDAEEAPQEEVTEEIEEPEEDASTEDEEEAPQEEAAEEVEEPEEGIFTEDAIETRSEERQEDSAKEQELLEGSTGELVMSLGDKIQNNTMQDEYNRVNLQEEIAKSMASILGNLQLDNENEEEKIQEPQAAATKRIPDVPQESGGDTKRIPDISQMKGMFQPVNAMSEPKPEDEQIEGQLSLEDVMAQFENTSQESDTEEKEEPISYFTRPIFGEEFTEGIKEALGENSSLQDELMQDMEGAEDLQEQSQNMVTDDMVTDEYLEQMEPTAQIQEEEEYQAPVFNVQSFRDMEQPSQKMQTLQEEQVTEQAIQEETVVPEASITPEATIAPEAPIIQEQTIAPETPIISEQTIAPETPVSSTVHPVFAPENDLSRKELLESAENAFEDWYDKGKAPVAATAEEPKEPVKVEMEHHTDPAFEKMRQKKEEKKNKGRKRIPESKRAAFASFLEIKDLEEQIATTLENLAYHSSNDGTSSTNNVMIAGETKSGKTTLALELIKTSNKDRSRTGRKVAKVKGSTLNKRGIKNVMAKLLGTDLIIEQAGSLMPQQVSELIETLSGFTGNMLVILEDDKVAIDRLVELHPQLGVMFSNQIVIKGYDINEWVRIAKEYAQSQDYGVDEMGTLALYAKINDVYGKKKEVEKKDVQMIIDDAIKHSEKKNIGKIFEIVFSRKYKDSDLTMLRESDFQ